jgi:hypothetical protein
MEDTTMTYITRAEHLAWCKQRALEYVDAGDLQNAFNSMASDMSKHPETNNPDLQDVGLMLLLAGDLDTPEKMRAWINGFN